ncbi:MAG: 2-methylisocitrate lyase-like PEP mutase family enzyme [Gammaproteobacteria bacterium]|jgi:2-methylisocitrate lyase-like PEP mutase family enzyme
MTQIGETFRALHVKGDPFILANVWDAGSAKMMAHMGAKALATSSAAHAFTLGRPDGGTLTRDEALAHAQDICSATTLPVQGDFENGFGDDPDTCAETVRLSAETGLAGICIEDIQFPAGTPYDFDLAVERMKAAASAARGVGRGFVLTARADGIMTGAYSTSEAIRRLQAFDAVGVDCLYAPMPPSMADVARICASTDKPVNVLVAGPYAKHNLAAFAQAGAARLSLGSALARVTHQAIFDAGRAMLGNGDFTALSSAMSGADVNAMLT